MRGVVLVIALAACTGHHVIGRVDQDAAIDSPPADAPVSDAPATCGHLQQVCCQQPLPPCVQPFTCMNGFCN
jgi:hypothetical protein